MEHAYTVAALYQFRPWTVDVRSVKKVLERWCHERALCGSLLIAEEGVNGTVAGKAEDVRALRDHLGDCYGFKGLEYKESYAHERPFWRMKVKCKREIVTLGQPEADPQKMGGTYVAPADWNHLLSNPKTIVIDVRNDYENAIGTFCGALNPNTKTFCEFPHAVESWNLPKDQPVATFCTGGIRCEKATAHLKKTGFKEVYHLKGGILKYLEEVSELESVWQGACFVFDHRVAVGHGLKPTDHSTCYGCRHPLTVEDQKHSLYEVGVVCHRCALHTKEKDRERFRQRHKQVCLAAQRNELHIGRRSDNMPHIGRRSDNIKSSRPL